MNPSPTIAATPGMSQAFREVSIVPPEQKPRRKRKGSPVFKMRLTPEERAHLEREAGETPLATYIKLRLFNNLPPLSGFGGSGKRPGSDVQLIAKLLAALGEARLANNLNQLAKAANMGTLEVSKDTENELLAACAEVHAMRRDLVMVLGLKAKDAP